jgi:hypothetical protein
MHKRDNSVILYPSNMITADPKQNQFLASQTSRYKVRANEDKRFFSPGEDTLICQHVTSLACC